MGGVIVILTLALGGIASAADRRMELNAREAFAAGRFDQALGLFAKLYAETLHPVYLRNIGRCHQKMRKPQEALDSFHDYLAKAKKVGPEEKEEIEGYIREMEALRDEQVRASTTAPPPSVAPSVVPPVPPISPPATPPLGPRTSSPPAAVSPSPSVVPLVTASGAVSESSPPVYKRWWFWTGVGVVLVGGAVAAVMLSGGGTTRPPCIAAACM